jgi:LacI family transcriptional regulator
MRGATIHDVARRAGVSIKTVSRVVNGATTVGDEIRERVTEAIVELQYVPNSWARSLKAGTGDTIGVVIDTIADPFFAALTSAIESRAQAAGLSVIFGSTGFDAERERHHVQRMAMQRVEALVLAPVLGPHDYLDQYRGAFPLVLIDRAFDITGFDVIVVDDRNVTRRAVDHLIAHGHRRIAFVGSDERYPTTVDRLAGYRDSLGALDINPPAEWVRPGPTQQVDASEVTAALLELPNPPTAIFAANPRAAVGVAHRLHSTGRQDVALISFGDFTLADTLRPAVTFVNQDPVAIGVAAIERVLTHLEARRLRHEESSTDLTEDEPRTTLVASDLVQRGSGEVPAP